MGGQIGIESEPGQGSLVWFQVRMGKQQGSETWRLESGPLRGKQVLVVDDVASCRGVLAGMLAGWGMEVSTADDPSSALEMLQVGAEAGSPFEFALIDYDMPGLGGLGLAEAILDDPATAGTQLVLMVPHSHRGWQDEPVLFGIEAVISKPVRELQLLEVLVSCTESARRADLARLKRRLIKSEPDQSEPTAPENPRPSVLIVEDNSVNQRVTVRLVEKMGCRPEVVANGEEALVALSRRRYDVILMDCQMPVMDGFETTAAIRQIEQGGPATPIIAMTANAMQGDRENCLNAGMDDYLSKPVSYEDLRATVTKWLGARENG
jgi:CheY-like chemotaxis protein